MRTIEDLVHLFAIALLITTSALILIGHMMPVALFALINAWGFVFYTNKDHE
ncbi:hypothetical protein [Schaalia cardiffensis]|uniref:hypothetical protein n=1 Tax=Schaalia cardiffensis TaxID=181487 RepID=UPI0023F4076A|nr:hypothetical protein [Schaalia cardiffensis]